MDECNPCPTLWQPAIWGPSANILLINSKESRTRSHCTVYFCESAASTVCCCTSIAVWRYCSCILTVGSTTSYFPEYMYDMWLYISCILTLLCKTSHLCLVCTSMIRPSYNSCILSIWYHSSLAHSNTSMTSGDTILVLYNFTLNNIHCHYTSIASTPYNSCIRALSAYITQHCRGFDVRNDYDRLAALRYAYTHL